MLAQDKYWSGRKRGSKKHRKKEKMKRQRAKKCCKGNAVTALQSPV